jgi:hypothetical protein
LNTHGITLNTPPNVDLFAHFYKTQDHKQVDPPSTPALPVGSLPTLPMTWPMFDLPMVFSQGFSGFILLGLPQPSHLNTQQSSALKHTGTTSSDGDQHHKPYPFISTFLSELANANLNHPTLTTIAAKFKAEDPLTIDELS